MRIRMIFATPGEDKTDWKVGEIREASAEFGRQLVKEGRAEPVDPETVEVRDPKIGKTK
jgi:hypothetical protein